MVSEQHYHFNLTENRQQLGIGTPELFPCLCFRVDVRRNVCHEIPWHWHEEIEVITIAQGRGLVHAGRETWLLEKGDGLFLNANTFHRIQTVNGGICRFHSLVFTADLLAGAPGSVFEQRYVRPLLRSSTRKLLLRQDVPWQKQAIDAIEEAYHAFDTEEFGWELLARAALSRLWQLAAKYADLTTPAEEESSDVRRLRAMLQCIRENYSRPLLLEEIAAAANIGKRECLRCFRRTIGITPIQCLMKTRIRQASHLLAETDLPVTEIGLQCGFENPSYFAQAFRRITGQSPKSYRRYFAGAIVEDEEMLEAGTPV